VSAARQIVGGVRWPAMIAVWVAWGFGAGMVLAVTAPLAFGLHPLTVLTGSMQPTIMPGDMVVDEPVPATQVSVGDIVTYREPHGTRTITHRVRSVSISEGQAHIVTKGDANHTVEKWQIPVTGKVGRVAYQVPKIGYPVTWAHTRNGRLALVSIPAFVLGIWALLRIWRPDEEQETEKGEVAHGIES
jgi:signal peptidase I